MHAKPDLRVFFEVWIAGSGSVITDVLIPIVGAAFWLANDYVQARQKPSPNDAP